MRTKTSVLRAWQQVSVANGRGDTAGANSAAREAARATDWDAMDPNAQRGEWRVFAVPFLSGGQVFVDSQAKVIAVARGLWDTLALYGPAKLAFFEQMTTGASGMKFLTTDAGAYAEAARMERNLSRAEAGSKDPLVALERRIGSLVGKVRHMNREPAEVHRTMFTGTLRELRAEMDELEARTARLRALLETAEDAVLSL